jgi:hypothetical protein
VLHDRRQGRGRRRDRGDDQAGAVMRWLTPQEVGNLTGRSANQVMKADQARRDCSELQPASAREGPLVDRRGRSRTCPARAQFGRR